MINFRSIYNKAVRKFSGYIVHKKIKLNLNETIVSFTFDDVPNSGFRHGLEIYKKYGFCSTYYVALSFYEKNGKKESQYDPQYLQQAMKDGSELGCHTYNHIHVTQTSEQAIIHDLDINQTKVNEYFPNYKFVNFSYPFGEQTVAAKRVMLNRFRTARGIKGGINHGIVDFVNLKAYELNDRFTLEKIKIIIDNAIRLKGWLIFYTHDVSNDPTPYGCTPEMFDFAAKYCYQKKVSVLSIREAMKKIVGKEINE